MNTDYEAYTMSEIQRLKQLGHECFEQSKYDDAIVHFTSCLTLSPNREDILSSRAEAYLSNEQYQAALKDSELVLSRNSFNGRASFQYAKALYGLERYETAIGFLQNVIRTKEAFRKGSFRTVLVDCKTRLLEQREAKYDWAEVEYCSLNGVENRVANYSGPIISKFSHGKGRGLFATEDIGNGQVIMVSKAFVSVYFKAPEAIAKSTRSSFDKKHFDEQSGHYMLSAIKRVLKRRPEDIYMFYCLDAGPELGYIDRERAKMTDWDEIRARQIVKINSINCCDGSFLHIKPSLINHNCIDWNCSLTSYGNLVVIRAKRLIKQDEEILISYLAGRISLETRSDDFRTRGFTCTCRLCEVEKNEDRKVVEKRYTIINGLFMGEYGTKNPRIMKSILSEITQLTRSSPFQLYYLSTPLIYYARCLELKKTCDDSNGIYDRILHYARKGNSSLLHIDGKSLAKFVAFCYLHGCKTNHRKWLPLYKELYTTEMNHIFKDVDPAFENDLNSAPPFCFTSNY